MLWQTPAATAGQHWGPAVGHLAPRGQAVVGHAVGLKFEESEL